MVVLFHRQRGRLLGDTDATASERWLKDPRIGIVSRPEIRFALPVILEGLGLEPESTDLAPKTRMAKARTPITQIRTPAYLRRVQGEIGSKLFRLLGVDATVLIDPDPDDTMHVWVTVQFNEKDVKP